MQEIQELSAARSQQGLQNLLRCWQIPFQLWSSNPSELFHDIGLARLSLISTAHTMWSVLSSHKLIFILTISIWWKHTSKISHRYTSLWEIPLWWLLNAMWSLSCNSSGYQGPRGLLITIHLGNSQLLSYTKECAYWITQMHMHTCTHTKCTGFPRTQINLGPESTPVTFYLKTYVSIW